MKLPALIVAGVVMFSLAINVAVYAAPSSTEISLDDEAYKAQQPHIVTGTREAMLVAELERQIAPVVQAEYGAPFHFYLIDETDPDAFSYYGPRVYVSVGMVRFADNREELAGVLCHETSHVMHHDGLRSAIAQQRDNARVSAFLHGAMKMTHNHFARIISTMAGAGERLGELHYSRGQEEAADLTGADTCSAAHSNPWGISWMLAKFQKYAPSHGIAFLSDHPSNKTRIARLKHHLHDKRFAQWSSNQRSATPLVR